MIDTIYKYITGKVGIRAIKDNGTQVDLSSTNEGHLEVAIHDPILPAGSLHSESITPIFQVDAVYGINTEHVSTQSVLSGSATASESMFVLSTGTTANASANLQSRKRLRYRPGQGVIARFAGLFTTGVANSYQLIGIGHAEDGYYFGYQGANFGVLYVCNGVREVRTLTITTGSSTAENVTITLNGVAYTVAVTNSANIQRTVWEIAQGTYTGWKAEALGATVRFVADSAGPLTGTYSITATTAQGTYARTNAGVASTDTFIPQSSWNGDKLDGTGGSGVTIDPTKANVYQIGVQYLDAGAVIFRVMVCPTNQNNAVWVTAHTIKHPNTLTRPHVSNPSFPFTMAAYSSGSTTNLTVKCGSFAGYVEGRKKLHGNRLSYINALTTVGATNIQALFTIKNDRFFASRVNQAIINVLDIECALKHTSPCIIYLIRNGTLAGNPNFQKISTYSVSSWDTAATTVSYTNGEQLLWTGHIGDTGDIDHSFEIGDLEELTIQPGEWITLAAKATTGTPAWVTGSVNTREDQ